MLDKREYKRRKESVRMRDIDKYTTKRDKELLDEYFLEWTRREYIKEHKTAYIKKGWLYGGMRDLYGKNKEIEGIKYKIVNVAVNEKTGKEELFGIGSKKYEVDERWLKGIRVRMGEQVGEIVGIKKKRLREEHYKYECGVVGRLITEGKLEGIEDESTVVRFVEYGLGLPREYREKSIEVGVNNIDISKEKLLSLLRSPIAILQKTTKESYKIVKGYLETGEVESECRNKRLVAIYGSGTPSGFKEYLERWTQEERELIKIQMSYRETGIEWGKLGKHYMWEDGIEIEDIKAIEMMIINTTGVLNFEGVRNAIILEGVTLKREHTEGIGEQIEHLKKEEVRARLKKSMSEIRINEEREVREKEEMKEKLERRVEYIEKNDDPEIWYSVLVNNIIEWYKAKGVVSLKQRTLIDRYYMELKGKEVCRDKKEESLGIKYPLKDRAWVIKDIQKIQEDEKTPENIKEILRGIMRTKEISDQEIDIIGRVKELQEDEKDVVGYKKGTYMLKERPDLERRLEEIEKKTKDEDTKRKIDRVRRYGVVSDEIVERIEIEVAKGLK